MPSYTPSYGAGDALAAQTLYDQKNIIDWLVSNNQQGKGIITEVGIPGSSQAATDPIPGSGTGAKYDQRWDNVLQQWYEGANRANLAVTAWNASNWRVDLRAYETDDGTTKPLNYRTTVSSVIENNLNGTTVGGITIGAPRGVNLAGGEFSDRGPNGSLDRAKATEPGAGYYYPLPADITMLKNRGIDILRVPIRWERVQPVLKQPLDSTEMNLIATSVNAAASVGMKILLDVHNYARYDTTPTGANANGVYILGQNAPATMTYNGTSYNVGGTMTSCFADLWTRLATYFNGNAGMWGYDICNEPHDCPNGVSDWQEASRQAVEAIRAVSQTVKIAIEGYSYATVPAWTSTNGANAWMTQTIPAGQTNAGQTRNTDPNILWNGHHYFDPASNGYDGGYQDTYDTELSRASGQGFSSWSTAGYTAPATNNTTQSGIRKIFGSSFDSASDFGGQYDAINTGTNTVTIPFAGVGNPGNSLRVICSATSDEGDVRKSLTGTQNVRQVSFDFQIPSGSTLSTTGNFAVFHAWDNTYANDLLEARIIGSGAGYKMQFRQTISGNPEFSGSTVLNMGVWNNISVQVTDTQYLMYLNGSATPEITINYNNAGVNFGGIALGKFYGTNYTGTLYFDNLLAGLNATFVAPPNGGLLPAASVGVAVNKRGLIGII